MELRKCTDEQDLAKIEDLYMTAFPDNERKPFWLIVEKSREGSMEALAIEEDGVFLGLAIMILHRDIALLDYFAVSEESRGQGIGTKALAALAKRYPDMTVVIEIEDPDEPSDNPEERLRRRDFYGRSGFSPMPYKVWLYGVKMQILTDKKDVPFERYHRIFKEVYSEKSAKNISLAE